MAAVQDLPRLILQAILASQSPQVLQQQRKDAVAFLEQFKRADVASVLSVCASLMSVQQLALQYGAMLQPTDVVGVRLAAYQLFTEVVRNRWREVGAEQRVAATQLALQQFQEAVSLVASDTDRSSISGSSPGASPIRGKAAELLAVVVRQQGSAAYTELLPQLIAGAAAGPTQAELSCRVLHYISEDLTQFEVSGPGAAVGAAGDGGAVDAVSSPVGSGNSDAPDVTSKRAFLSALTASAPTVFPFLCEVLEQHFKAAQQLQNAPLPPAPSAGAGGAQAPGSSSAQQRQEQVAAHIAALSAALGALSTWVEWVPMRRLAASPVLSACTFFIREGTPALRMQALDVLRQITWRKRANETPADYTALMDGVGGALLEATAALGLLLGPQDPLPPAMIRELGYGGSQVEFGTRLLEVVEGLGEGHFRSLSEPAGRRAAFLAQLLTFTRHPYLRLSGGTLTLWHQLLREASPQHALCGGPAGGAGQQQQGEGGVGGSASGRTSPGIGGGKAGSQSYTLPVEVCSELMRVLCGTMARVVPSADPGVANVPDWCDSHAEYKEVVVAYRSQAKAILRAAAALAPEQSLQAAATLLSAALAACAAPPPLQQQASASAPSATAQLEAAVMVLTAVLQPLCDMTAAALGVVIGGGSGGGAGGGGSGGGAAAAAATAAAAAASGSPAARAAAAALVAGLADLLQAVLRVRLSDPRHMTLHAEAIEAFGRFLVLRPDLMVPTVSCCLEVMRLLPLEGPGQLPPPPRQTPEWRAQFEARLAMANVLLGLARAAPNALAPHLSALVTEIAALWDRGLLREGERVLLWEGLLAASSVASPLVQGELVKLIFEPIAQQWGSPEWQATVASPQAFVQSYMPLIPVASALPGGVAPAEAGASGASGTPAAAAAAPAYELGARERRWTIYHQVTLLERALRRTSPAGAAAAGPTSITPGSGLLTPSSSFSSSTAPASAAPGGSEHPFSAHLEWCLPPVARLVACVHALADPRVRPSLGPLAIVNEMDAIERAVRLGEDRDTVKAAEQSEPRCVAGSNVADARYFVRGVRECAYMVLNLATAHCGPALWRSEPLAALLPAAVAGGAAALGDHVVRLLVRHVLTPWAQRCPPARAGAWMVPLCGAFLPHMHERLTSGWAALQAPPATAGTTSAGPTAGPQRGPGGSGPGRPVGSSGSSGAAGTAAGADAASDEILRDTLLRELSREYLSFLNALATRRPAEDPAAAGGPAGMGVGGTGGVAAAGAGAAALSPRVSANGAGPLPSPTGTGPVMQECILEVVLVANPQAAQAGLAAGVSALCWPDADTAGRAVNFCKSLLVLAQSGHSELEGVVIGAVVRSAVRSLGLVSTVMAQTQILELLRLILSAYLPPRQPQAPLLMGVLAEIPGMSQQVLGKFTTALFAAHGDKEQRALIKQLLAEIGGDEVRTLLSAASKPSVGISAVPEPKLRGRGPILDITPQDMGLPHLFDLPDVL